jgi:hypothetical protein
MTREPDLDAVTRTLSVTVQRQQEEIRVLRLALQWILRQEPTIGAGDDARQILLQEIMDRAAVALAFTSTSAPPEHERLRSALLQAADHLRRAGWHQSADLARDAAT